MDRWGSMGSPGGPMAPGARIFYCCLIDWTIFRNRPRAPRPIGCALGPRVRRGLDFFGLARAGLRGSREKIRGTGMGPHMDPRGDDLWEVRGAWDSLAKLIW